MEIKKFYSENKSLLLSDVLLALILIIPVILFYIAHYCPPEGLIGTGFVQGEMGVYMANARQHFDDGSFRFLYANPFNLDSAGPHIYFQFQTLILGIAWYLSQADIGVVFMLFGFIAAFLSVLISIKLFKKLFGWGTNAHIIVFILFIYGGGALIFGGFFYNIIHGKPIIQSVLDCLVLDPGGGYWMLNLGRNFVYPTEAYYHLLTLSIVYAVISNKQKLLSFILFILAFSHPFYGIQFLLIVLAWQFLELVIFKKGIISRKYFIANLAILIVFFLYNYGFLNSFKEHQIIIKQWSLNWSLSFISSLLAYGPLFAFFIYKIRSKGLLKSIIAQSEYRFLLIYLSISIVLANHEIFIKPIQPIHFTHGHIYIPLFLLVADSLIKIFQRSGKNKYKIIKLALVLFLLFDNFSWFSSQYYNSIFHAKKIGLRVTENQINTIKYISKSYNSNYLVASEASNIEYLSTIYTSTYGLLPHMNNTPFNNKRLELRKQIFEKGLYNILPNYKLIIIEEIINGKIQKLKTNPNFKEVYKNEQYIIYERK